jgi:hypothetical protein
MDILDNPYRTSSFVDTKDVVPLVLLFVLPFAFFIEANLAKEVFWVWDITLIHYPLRVFTVDMMRQGHLPLWNPYVFCGYPHWAGGQIGMFYPLNFFFLLPIPPYYALTLFILTHFGLAGVFMYSLVRWLVGSRVGAFLSALAFMLGGFLVAQVIDLNLMTGSIWLPLIFLLFIRGVENRSFWYAFLTGLAIGFQALTANPQIIFLSGLLLVFYYLFRITTGWRREREPLKLRLTWSAILVLAFIVGLGLSAIQIVPTIELAKLSSRRSGLPYYIFTFVSLPPWHLLTLLLPNLWGKLALYWGYPYFHELYVYLGIIPLLLACLAWQRLRQSGMVAFLTISLLISLGMALGRFNPLYHFLQYVPGLNLFRVPARWLFLTTFSLSILTGYGSASLIQREKSQVIPTSDSRPRKDRLTRLFATLTVIGLAMTLIGVILFPFREGFLAHVENDLVAESLNRNAHFLLGSLLMVDASLGLLYLYLREKIPLSTFQVGCIVLTLVDLFSFDRDVNAFKPPSYYTKRPETLTFLERDAGFYRIATDYLLPFYEIEGLKGDVPSMYGIFSVHGGSALKTFRYETFMDEGGATNPKLLGLMNVKYVVTHQELSDANFRKVYESGHYNIYENGAFLPRVLVVPNAEPAPGATDWDIMRRLANEDFEPRQWVVLEEMPEEGFAPSSRREAGSARIVSYSLGRVVIEADLEADGFLVLLDTFYPGWKASVDGAPSKIYQADYLFRAVFLREGVHTIEFVYDPLSFKLSLAASSATLALSCLAFIVRFLSRLGGRVRF